MNILQEYSSIFLGLVIGTLAHFGRVISSGDLPTWSHVIGFIMQLGFIGIVAAVATSKLGITDDDMRALTTAVLAISAQEVIQYVKRSGWRIALQAAVPSTIEGEQRQAEQRARAFRHVEENGNLDEAFDRVHRQASDFDDDRKDNEK